MFRIRRVLTYLHRTAVMKHEPTYKFGILGDSIVFGTHVKKTMTKIVSYPTTLELRCFGRIRASQSHWGSDRSWYQQSCGQEKQIGIVDEIAAKLETLVKKFQEAGIPVTIMKIPGRVGYKEELKQLNRKYEKVAKRTGAHSHTPKRFTVGGSGEKDLTGGLHTDGLHPNPEYLQR